MKGQPMIVTYHDLREMSHPKARERVRKVLGQNQGDVSGAARILRVNKL